MTYCSFSSLAACTCPGQPVEARQGLSLTGSLPRAPCCLLNSAWQQGTGIPFASQMLTCAAELAAVLGRSSVLVVQPAILL